MSSTTSDDLQDFDDNETSNTSSPLDNVDDIGSSYGSNLIDGVPVGNSGIDGGGYQTTEGGVIMPEGGANPCVIKVGTMFYFDLSQYNECVHVMCQFLLLVSLIINTQKMLQIKLF